MSKIPPDEPPNEKSAADIHGPWVDPGIETGLVARCRKSWTTPISQLSNEMLATFLRQDIAVEFVAPEARRRVEAGIHDDSELYDDELAEALRKVRRDAT
jgi:hypothetical protein